MKASEWTFKIPNVLKEAVKQNKAFFQIVYKNDNEKIFKSLTVFEKDTHFAKVIELNDISEEELERQIDKFIYGER